MHPDTLSRRTVTFVNIAHALDHFVLLIYPDGRHRDRGGAGAGLRRADRAGDRGFRRLRAVLPADGLAVRAVWPAQSAGGVLRRLRGCMPGHFDGDDGDRLRGLAFRARGVLGDLPSDRRGDAGDPCPAAGARPRLERGLGQSGGRVGIGRDRRRRGDAGLAGGLRGSGIGLPCGGGGVPRPGSGGWRGIRPSGREPPGSFPCRVRWR